ncbi:uncharacterized protein RAG0_06926 [Rhynchosporium agropyri]|uniref:CENP-V/GFA domain-containing protein n=1 Tax=Rhynchosporium agropyri TaxID=914238 RepID=A0A1E1KJ24_9HELO|nr:uncharacterized protein RAG0_06926 [Rhynchosporium agropyri]
MTTAITSTCACHSFSVTIEFPNSELSINRALCLCNNCRRASGSCGWSSISIPPDQKINPSKFQTIAYESSKGVRRHFCTTCGAHAFTMVERTAQTLFLLVTGLWDRTEGVINWTGSKWVENTLDGGFSVWLTDMKRSDGTTKKLKRWARWDLKDGEIVPEGSLLTLSKKAQTPSSNDKLKAECLCGGAKFCITLPVEASEKILAPFPDLMVKSHLPAFENPKHETRCSQENDMKYLADYVPVLHVA